MFNNIGGKLKGLAKFMTWVGILVSLVFGIVLMVTGEELFMIIGVAVAIFGSLLSWVGSFLFYAIGQIAENTDILAGRIRPGDAETDFKNAANDNDDDITPTIFLGGKSENANFFCPRCGQSLSYTRNDLYMADSVHCVFCNHVINLKGRN